MLRRLLPLTIAVCAAILVLLATSTYGIGISAESETYVEAARNMASGRGLTIVDRTGQAVLMTQHAPLYAVVLAWMQQAGVETVAAARWFTAFCFAGLILLSSLIAQRVSQRWSVGAMVAASVAAAPPILGLHLVALSEPLFLFFVLLTWYTLLRYSETRSDGWFAACAAACSMSAVTRFPGVVLIAVGAFALWRAGQRVRAAGFALVASLPLAGWMAYARANAGNPVARQFAVHPVGRLDLVAAMQTVTTWLLPARVPLAVRLVLVAAILCCAWSFYRRTALYQKVRRRYAICEWLVVYVVAYAAMIAVAKSFFDRAIPMDDRILSPLYIPLLLAFLLWTFAATTSHRERVIAAVALALVCAVNGARDVRALATTYTEGREFNGAAWQRSNVTQWLQSVSPEAPVFTNVDSAVRFWRGGPVYGLPAKADVRSGVTNASFMQEMSGMRETLDGRDGVLLYLLNAGSDTLPSAVELQRALPLEEAARGEDWIALRRKAKKAIWPLIDADGR